MSNRILFYSSVTKKFIMAFAGLFLITFLMIHLIINLLLLRNDSGELFNDAAHFMGTNILIKIMEVFLLLGFIIHIIFGVILQIQNWLSRPVRYRIEGYSHTSFFSKFMIHTGIIVFIFLVIHFVNFYFIKLGIVQAPEGVEVAPDGHIDFYTAAVMLFQNYTYSIIYIVALIILAFHLNHAFQSAFQSLGLNHSKYTPVIKVLGILYSILVPLGFTIIPLYFLFCYNG
ncbi:succinate dehydrogenase cytochrome b subunit [candidate division KSB1 bacterium]